MWRCNQCCNGAESDALTRLCFQPKSQGKRVDFHASKVRQRKCCHYNVAHELNKGHTRAPTGRPTKTPTTAVYKSVIEVKPVSDGTKMEVLSCDPSKCHVCPSAAHCCTQRVHKSGRCSACVHHKGCIVENGVLLTPPTLSPTFSPTILPVISAPTNSPIPPTTVFPTQSPTSPTLPPTISPTLPCNGCKVAAVHNCNYDTCVQTCQGAVGACKRCITSCTEKTCATECNMPTPAPSPETVDCVKCVVCPKAKARCCNNPATVPLRHCMACITESGCSTAGKINKARRITNLVCAYDRLF